MAKWVHLLKVALPTQSGLARVWSLLDEALSPETTLLVNQAQEQMIVKFPWLREEMVVVPERAELRWDYPPGSGIFDRTGDPCYLNDVKVAIALTATCKERLQANDREWASNLVRILPLVLPTIYEGILSAVIVEARRLEVEALSSDNEHALWPEVRGLTQNQLLQDFRTNTAQALESDLPGDNLASFARTREPENVRLPARFTGLPIFTLRLFTYAGCGISQLSARPTRFTCPGFQSLDLIPTHAKPVLRKWRSNRIHKRVGTQAMRGNPYFV
jgi:hypothetical protein